MTENVCDEMKFFYAVDLSDKELLLIGKIVAFWGLLEHEIFVQTLQCLNLSSLDDLPKKVTSPQFSDKLELWKLYVLDKAVGERKAVLQDQYDLINRALNFRNAIVHGMWEWSAQEPEKITSMRFGKNKLHSTVFTAAALADFAMKLGLINFKLRFPGGADDYAAAMAEEGSYESRLGLCLMTGNPLALDLLPRGIADALKDFPDEEV